MPAVIASFSFLALAIRSVVRYASQKGCEMTTSASGSARSKADLGPSLSDEAMAEIFEGLAQSQPSRNRAEKLAELEIDLLRHRRRLAAGIARGTSSRAWDSG
jgi:hypothetical protein